MSQDQECGRVDRGTQCWVAVDVLALNSASADLYLNEHIWDVTESGITAHHPHHLPVIYRNQVTTECRCDVIFLYQPTKAHCWVAAVICAIGGYTRYLVGGHNVTADQHILYIKFMMGLKLQ